MYLSFSAFSNLLRHRCVYSEVSTTQLITVAVMSLCLMGMLWLNVNFQGEIFHIFLALLLGINLLSLAFGSSNPGCREKIQLKDTK